ncbi:MAG TPA: hypothetical protein GX401_01775 [Clostridiales bacterium]|nr:hypothetical protein [Clostridiales bacterium]
MKNKILYKGICLILILSVAAAVMTACNMPFIMSAEAHKLKPQQVSTGLVTINSFEKAKKTDAVTYSIKRLYGNGYEPALDNIKTNNGTTTKALSCGTYVITSDLSPDICKTIRIDRPDQCVNIDIENNEVYSLLSAADKVCMVGDSITAGSCTDGHGWFERLISGFSNIKGTDVAARGGQTSASIFIDTDTLNKLKQSTADTYIIALGVNDVICRDNDTVTTSSASEYIENMKKLVSIIKEKENGDQNKIIFVSPFIYQNKATAQLEKYIKRDNVHQEYIYALKAWCREQDYPCVDMMNYVTQYLSCQPQPDSFMVDDLHPSYKTGTTLYSDAFFSELSGDRLGTLAITQDFYKKSTTQDNDQNKTTYSLENQDNNIHSGTAFTIQNYSTKKYIEVYSYADDSPSTGEYVFKSEAQTPISYFVGSSSRAMIINNLPEGCYTITVTGNSYNKASYRTTTVMYVSGSDTITTARLPMAA